MSAGVAAGVRAKVAGLPRAGSKDTSTEVLTSECRLTNTIASVTLVGYRHGLAGMTPKISSALIVL